MFDATKQNISLHLKNLFEDGELDAAATVKESLTVQTEGTRTINEFDLYYQDVQKRIKDQQWPNFDFPAAQKIDITIVVDMLLTGFDSKYLITLYVDKNLKYHGLIQAFSRTNRVPNGTKPYGNTLDFRQQQSNVDAAIALFSGEKIDAQCFQLDLHTRHAIDEDENVVTVVTVVRVYAQLVDHFEGVFAPVLDVD